MKKLLIVAVVIVIVSLCIFMYILHEGHYNESSFFKSLMPESSMHSEQSTITVQESVAGEQKDVSLSPAHIEMLDSFNVDPAMVPTAISLEQETCFREVLGDQRVDEILGGDVPSLIEMMKGKSCIESQ